MSENLYKQEKDISSIIHFPEGTASETGDRFYGEDSYDMHMAVLSHYIYNSNLHG